MTAAACYQTATHGAHRIDSRPYWCAGNRNVIAAQDPTPAPVRHDPHAAVFAPCDHEPDDAGAACRYCGLPAEPVDPQEAAEHLYCAFVNHQDRDRWSEALAGAAVIARAVPTLARPNRSYPADMPAQLSAIARWHRADRIERDR